MAKKVRMADIAQELGISIVSVSKALAGKDGVSKEMRAKIMESADKLGYSLPKSEKNDAKISGNIGILVADRFFSDNAFYSSLYRNVLMKSTAAGYSALLEIVSAEDEKDCVMPAMILGKKVDGLIFMGEISREYLRAALQSCLPYMLLDFYDAELAADSVISDGVSGEYRLTHHVVDTGRTKIGFVGSIFSTSSIMDRYLGYTKALLCAGLPICSEWRIEDRDEQGHFIPIELPETMPQAFVCSCDEVAYNVMEKLKANGYKIPEDVAVVGYDDYRFAQLCDPQLTTYRVNIEGMGAAVVSQLIRKIKGKKTSKGTMIINGHCTIRKST